MRDYHINIVTIQQKKLKLTHFFLDRLFRENLNFLLEVQNSLFSRHQA